MKVAIVRSGGITGMSTRTELIADALPAAAAATLSQLVEQAELGASMPTPTFPDALAYEVEVDHDGKLSRGSFTDASIPDGVRRLVEWVDGRPEKTLGPAR